MWSRGWTPGASLRLAGVAVGSVEMSLRGRRNPGGHATRGSNPGITATGGQILFLAQLS